MYLYICIFKIKNHFEILNSFIFHIRCLRKVMFCHFYSCNVNFQFSFWMCRTVHSIICYAISPGELMKQIFFLVPVLVTTLKSTVHRRWSKWEENFIVRRGQLRFDRKLSTTTGCLPSKSTWGLRASLLRKGRSKSAGWAMADKRQMLEGWFRLWTGSDWLRIYQNGVRK